MDVFQTRHFFFIRGGTPDPQKIEKPGRTYGLLAQTPKLLSMRLIFKKEESVEKTTFLIPLEYSDTCLTSGWQGQEQILHY
jgi:hypothetical protein